MKRLLLIFSVIFNLVFLTYYLYNFSDNKSSKNSQNQIIRFENAISTNYEKIIEISSNESISNLQIRDKYLNLSKYNSEEFMSSDEFKYLKRFPSFWVYVLIDFDEASTYDDILKLTQ